MLHITVKGQPYGHHINKLGRPWVPKVLYQVSWFSVCWFWKQDFSKPLKTKGLLPNMGMVAMLVNRLELFEQIFILHPWPQTAKYEIRLQLTNRLQNRSFENADDRRTTDPVYPSFPGILQLRELKKKAFNTNQPW